MSSLLNRVWLMPDVESVAVKVKVTVFEVVDVESPFICIET